MPTCLLCGIADYIDVKICDTVSKMSLAVAWNFDEIVSYLFFVIKICKGQNLLENQEKKGDQNDWGINSVLGLQTI